MKKNEKPEKVRDTVRMNSNLQTKNGSRPIGIETESGNDMSLLLKTGGLGGAIFSPKKLITATKMKPGYKKPQEDLESLFSPITEVKSFASRIRLNAGPNDPISATHTKFPKIGEEEKKKNEASPTRKVHDGFLDTDNSTEVVNYEGQCYLKTKTDSYKKHWMVLLGNELYFQKRKGDKDHKVMHCLTGTYLKEMNEETNSSQAGSEKEGGGAKKYYPIKIVIPPNKSRLVFFSTRQE